MTGKLWITIKDMYLSLDDWPIKHKPRSSFFIASLCSLCLNSLTPNVEIHWQQYTCNWQNHYFHLLERKIRAKPTKDKNKLAQKSQNKWTELCSPWCAHPLCGCWGCPSKAKRIHSRDTCWASHQNAHFECACLDRTSSQPVGECQNIRHTNMRGCSSTTRDNTTTTR